MLFLLLPQKYPPAILNPLLLLLLIQYLSNLTATTIFYATGSLPSDQRSQATKSWQQRNPSIMQYKETMGPIQSFLIVARPTSLIMDAFFNNREHAYPDDYK